MFNFTTETLFNDLSRFSVIDNSTAPVVGALTLAGSTTGGALAAATYYYKVTLVNAKGESTGSAESSVTTTGTTSSVAVSWAAVPGATSYKIYRGTSAGAESLYFTSLTNSFTDIGGASTAGTVPVSNTAGINDAGVPLGDKALFVKRLNKFLASNTKNLWKRPGTAAVNEVATITVPTGAVAAGTYRLSLDVITSGSYPANYDRWAINKGKPFYVEVNMTASADATTFATNFAAGVVRGLKKANGYQIKDIVVTSAGPVITITAGNEYLRIKGGIIEFYDTTLSQPDYTLYASKVTTTSGAEGFATSWFLTKNFRLPTDENIRFMGEDQDERPVTGVLYNQYTLHYEAARNITGDSVVGQKAVTQTDHIFYIPQTLATTFEGLLTSAFGSILVTV